MIVCVPDQQAVTELGELPDGVSTVVWNGVGPAPDGAAEAEFLIAPYGVPAPVADLVAGLPKLRTVQLLSAGVDAWLDVLPAGVVLCRGVGIHADSTAELALALVLASLRELPRFVRQQDEQRWQPVSAENFAGKRVLIVGAGEIGHAIARRVAAFEAVPTLVGRSARDGVRATSELPRLLADHEVVIVVVPLTDETHGLVDEGFLAAMPDGALLVNVARGPVVDTGALLAELRTGRLRAALDVTDPEPLPSDHPLWTLPSVLITPHVGGGTTGWQRRAYPVARAQLLRQCAGEPLQYVVTGRY